MSDWTVDPKQIGIDGNGRQAGRPVSPIFLDRWSPRAFTGEPNAQETLETLFEAARWTSSACNSQPWRFVYPHRDTPAFDAFVSFGIGSTRGCRL